VAEPCDLHTIDVARSDPELRLIRAQMLRHRAR
jgi:hypothetical protein